MKRKVNAANDPKESTAPPDADLIVIRLMETTVSHLFAKLHITLKPKLVPIVSRAVVLAVVFGSVLLTDLVTGAHLANSGNSIFSWIENHSTIAATVITAFVLMIGASAAAWKQIHQGSYAVVEILFGICFGLNVAKDLVARPTGTKLFLVGSAAYLIARGFNNAVEAKKASTLSKPQSVEAAASS